MSPVGQVQLTFTYKYLKHNIQFQAANGNVPAILGRTWMVSRIYEIKIKDDPLKDIDNLFSGLGCLPIEHRIKTDDQTSDSSTKKGSCSTQGQNS